MEQAMLAPMLASHTMLCAQLFAPPSQYLLHCRYQELEPSGAESSKKGVSGKLHSNAAAT